MKRYIEIVYDNSGSMNELVGKKKKFEIAQELFEKEILPTIGIKGDHVVLRLLRSRCEEGYSIAEKLPSQRSLMISRIKSIQHDQSTPLFYTVYDAVEACRNIRADEYFIFVLTDGDDTCGVSIKDLIDENTLNKFVKFLLVQFAIDSLISRNNLTALANAMGGQSIALDSKDSILHMRKKLRVALNVSGFSNKIPLEHCFDRLPGFDVAWDEIEESGISFHQAMLLYQKSLLSWIPDLNLNVTALQLSELRFLYSLLFKSGIPEDLTKTMLSQLKKPYYYSFDCIYWDFNAARWRYFMKQNQIQQMPNRAALLDDYPLNDRMLDLDDGSKYYEENKIYRVELANSPPPSFRLVPDEGDDELASDLINFKKNTIRILEPGDKVKFLT